MRAAALALAALVWTGCAASPPAAPDLAPARQAVEAYIAAFAAEDWRAAAERIDRADLARLQPFVGLIGGMAVEDPDFDGAAPPDDPVDAFVWFMEAMTEQVPMFGDLMGTAQGEVLGVVSETDSLAHVVQRSTVDMLGTEVSQVEVVTARLGADGRWRVALGGQLEGIAGMTGLFESMGEIDDSDLPEVYVDDEDGESMDGDGRKDMRPRKGAPPPPPMPQRQGDG